MSKFITISATVLNNHGHLLPYTTRSTKSSCEDDAKNNLAVWNRQIELGARIVQTAILNIEDMNCEQAIEVIKTFYNG